jgi:hypothetical protein
MKNIQFIKITPLSTGRPRVIAVRTVVIIEPVSYPTSPDAQSLITFDTGARSLVSESIDEIAAAARG